MQSSLGVGRELRKSIVKEYGGSEVIAEEFKSREGVEEKQFRSRLGHGELRNSCV